MSTLYHGSLIGAMHRRLAQCAMMDANEWFFWGSPGWYRYHVKIARKHLRLAWKWEEAP